MPILEERVTGLEIRVDELTVRCGDAARDAASAKDAQRQNIQLLNALRTTQAEHTRILHLHSTKLDEHSRKLDEHGRILDQHTQILNEHTTILRKLTVGMHGIERMLKYLIDKDGAAN